jgi:hypothetical protein
MAAQHPVERHHVDAETVDHLWRLWHDVMENDEIDAGVLCSHFLLILCATELNLLPDHSSI